jgi:hypothetical protein
MSEARGWSSEIVFERLLHGVSIIVYPVLFVWVIEIRFVAWAIRAVRNYVSGEQDGW